MHVETNDSEAVQHALDRLLEPGFAAYVGATDHWVSVIAEQLETFEPEDLEQLAVPLSNIGLTIGFFGQDDDVQVWRFPSKDHQRVTWAELEARAGTLDIPLEHITHFDALEETPTAGFVRLEREPEKPGLKEFFGRSQDE